MLNGHWPHGLSTWNWVRDAIIIRDLLRDCTTGCGTDGSFYSTRLQPSEQQHCAWINRTLEIHRKCVNVHWLWGSHELRFLRRSRGVIFSPFRHRLRRSDILLSSTNSSPTIGLVENETKNFCVSDSTMHLKTPLKSPADGWGTEADFRNPFLLRSPESQYYNANVPRHLQWRGGLHT